MMYPFSEFSMLYLSIKKLDLIIVKVWTKDPYAVTMIDKEVVVLFNFSCCIKLIAIYSSPQYRIND